MRTPIIALVLGLLLLFQFSAAFDVNDYLYEEETAESVGYTDFTLDGTAYSIVSISGEKTFLLKEGSPVNSSSEIEDVVSRYYEMEYYPSEEEIDELEELIERYNDSRNDGQKFAGKEEYVCRSVIFIDGRVKSGPDPIYCRNEDDEEMCKFASMLMYQFLSSVSGAPPVASYDDLLGPIKEFGFASYGTDTILDNIDSRLNEAKADKSKIYDALTYIDDSIPTLEGYIEDVEDTLFGWTKTKGCDTNHWCLCPDIDLDEDALGDLDDYVDELLGKVGPFSECSSVAASINSNTAARFTHYGEELLASDYGLEFGPLADEGKEVIEKTDEILTHVSNATLSSDLERLKELNSSITSKINERNFTNLEFDISEYEYALSKVDSASSSIILLYSDVGDAKNTADALMLVLSSRDMQGYSGEKVNEFSQQIEEFNVLFSTKLTVDELSALKDSYDRIISEGNELIAIQQTEPTYGSFLAFRGFAKDVNEGLSAFAERSELAEPASFTENETLAFGGFATIVFVSFSALCIILFLSLMLSRRFFNAKVRVITLSVFVFFLIIIGVFSFGLYYYMDKTAVDATVGEFMEDFEEKESAAIAMDLAGLSGREASSIEGCGMTLYSSLIEKNKSVTVYRIYADSCVKSSDGSNETQALWECEEALDSEDAVVMLTYSTQNENPEFSTVYKTEAVVKANSDYYTTCPVIALLK